MNSCVILFENLEMKSMEKILDVKYNIQNIKIFFKLIQFDFRRERNKF